MVSDCLSPAASLKHSKHHKLSEADNVDTPPARPMSDPMYSQGEEEQVQSRQQEPGMTNGQPSQKRLRVAPVVRHLHAVLVITLLEFIMGEMQDDLCYTAYDDSCHNAQADSC